MKLRRLIQKLPIEDPARPRQRGDRLGRSFVHAICCTCSGLQLAQSGHARRVACCPLSEQSGHDAPAGVVATRRE